MRPAPEYSRHFYNITGSIYNFTGSITNEYGQKADMTRHTPNTSRTKVIVDISIGSGLISLQPSTDEYIEPQLQDDSRSGRLYCNPLGVCSGSGLWR